MNKNLDFQIYDSILQSQTSQLSQKQVIHSRICKFSSTKSQQHSYEMIGLALAESKMFEKSLWKTRRLLIMDPELVRARQYLINNLFSLKRDNEAFSYMKRHLCLNYDYYWFHSFVIRTFHERGQIQDLVPFYEEAATLLTDKTRIPILFYQCAQMLVSCEHYQQALITYKKAIETSAMKEPKSLYFSQYAMALYHEGEFEEALVQFEHAWKLDPSEKNTINNIAYLNYCLGRVEKALEGLEEIIEKGLETHGTHPNYLLVLYHLDKDEETIEKTKKIIEKSLLSNSRMWNFIYKKDLRQTELRLENEISEESKEFYMKKIQGLKMLLSIVQ